MEVWKEVPGTDGYIEVSTEGRVRSWLSGRPRILMPQTDKKGYLRITTTIKRISHTYKVHRLVAQAFVPNPDMLPQVNHKDGNKKNNIPENLEWVTNQQNTIHSFAMALGEKGSVEDITYIPNRITIDGKQHYLNRNYYGIRKPTNPRKPLIAFKDGVRMEFESVSAAERHFGSRHISDVLKGKRSHVKGWSFSYKEGGDASASFDYLTA